MTWKDEQEVEIKRGSRRRKERRGCRGRRCLAIKGPAPGRPVRASFPCTGDTDHSSLVTQNVGLVRPRREILLALFCLSYLRAQCFKAPLFEWLDRHLSFCSRLDEILAAFSWGQAIKTTQRKQLPLM